jgi:hypothetical protein
MIVVSVTPEDIVISKIRAEELGVLNQSILNGNGNLTGCIGETVVAKYLGTDITGNYDHDIVWNGLRMEVKSKLTSVYPKKEYECSVAAANPNQKCDLYVFTRVHVDMDTAYILGYITKEDFFRKADRLYKGMVCGSNGFVVRENCYNVTISDLMSFEHFKTGDPK